MYVSVPLSAYLQEISMALRIFAEVVILDLQEQSSKQ